MMNDSSSSSSSLDGLSFILEELSHDTPVLNYILDSETDIKTLELLMKLRQAREKGFLIILKTTKEDKVY